MTIFGIGPIIAISGAVAAAAVFAFKRITGCTLALPFCFYEWIFWGGIVFLATGMYFWISSVILVKRAFTAHQLVQSGVYSVSRNPMYAGFILFIVPGFAFVANDLLLLVISVSMFVAFKIRVGQEEDFLQKEFGDEFERYRKKVPQLIPLVRI